MSIGTFLKHKGKGRSQDNTQSKYEVHYAVQLEIFRTHIHILYEL